MLLYDVFYAHSKGMDRMAPWSYLELIAARSKSDRALIGTTASLCGGQQHYTLTQDGWRED
jgi:hypothetical protein